MAGVHIGNGAVIASWAVVTKDVPPYTIVAERQPGRLGNVLMSKRLPDCKNCNGGIGVSKRSPNVYLILQVER